jgi:hypothetical protein
MVYTRHVLADTSANSLHMTFNVNTICKQYGIPQCVHSVNVPVLCFHIWPDDGSFEPKHVAEFLILITIYNAVLLTEIIYYIIVIRNGMAPIKEHKRGLFYSSLAIIITERNGMPPHNMPVH